MNNIIEELLKEMVSVEVEYDPKMGIVYILHGFYKSDTVKLIENESGILIAYARYNEKTVIESVKDIVKLNYDWFSFSEDRHSSWSTPDNRWFNLLVKYGFYVN